jgi:hypothetical protein
MGPALNSQRVLGQPIAAQEKQEDRDLAGESQPPGKSSCGLGGSESGNANSAGISPDKGPNTNTSAAKVSEDVRPKAGPFALPVQKANATAIFPAKIQHFSVSPEAQPALLSLEKFLLAPNWKARLPYCRKLRNLPTLMQEHYNLHADGPTQVERIEMVGSYTGAKTRIPYFLFELSGGCLQESLFALVDNPAGMSPCVDWEMFVEFKDHRLMDYFRCPDSGRKCFHVMLSRTHSFDRRVPDLDGKDCFSLLQPGSNEKSSAYALRQGAVDHELSDRLDWGREIPATLELVWRRQDSSAWVELVSVAGYDWRD